MQYIGRALRGQRLFLRPFGAQPGRSKMTKYFMQDTPLADLERLMMTPPKALREDEEDDAQDRCRSAASEAKDIPEKKNGGEK